MLFVSSRAFSLSIEKIFQKLFKTFYRPWERIIGAEYDTERKCTFLIINQFSVWVCIKSLFQLEEAQIQSPFVSGGGTYYKTFILFLIKTHELKFFLTKVE